MDGQRWGFSPTNHQLLASMVSVVGENGSTLVIPGLAFMVFGLMLGRACGGLRRRASSSTWYPIGHI
ncbi:hypothetical protein [Legionella sp. km535]|uniref:hypothetical protein n=1 Tax=Legionella sp. km535 TaxID=2498107 RepID=UPI0013155177|nr:hypothetical protein [Legionella sp. km535]